MKSHLVMLCCNHGDDGSFTGRVAAIEIDDLISLTCTGREPSLTIDRFSIKLGRSTYASRAHAQWVGNWCWDSVRMETAETKRLLERLLKSGKWAVEEYSEDGPFVELARSVR